MPVLQPHRDESRWFGLFRFRSPLLTESRFLSLPPGTEMFQFPGLATCTYGFSARNSGSRDQRSFDSSPGLFAVFHALHRLLVPRHPPHALTSLAALFAPSPRVTASRSRTLFQLASLPNLLGKQVGSDDVAFLISKARVLSLI